MVIILREVCAAQRAIGAQGDLSNRLLPVAIFGEFRAFPFPSLSLH